jgi:hypothetical protein
MKRSFVGMKLNSASLTNDKCLYVGLLFPWNFHNNPL